MAETKAKKLSYDEMFNSTTMFYINDSCEESIRKTIDAQTADILVGLKTITSKETLKQYIIDHKDSLDRLTSVAEISEERFKRMVSMIRKDRGFVFATEWGLSKIRSAMMESPAMMESVLNLIWDGKTRSQDARPVSLRFIWRIWLWTIVPLPKSKTRAASASW